MATYCCLTGEYPTKVSIDTERGPGAQRQIESRNLDPATAESGVPGDPGPPMRRRVSTSRPVTRRLRIKDVVASPRPGVLGEIGGFGGLSPSTWVDTQAGLGRRHPRCRHQARGRPTGGRYDSVGIDLVAMSVTILSAWCRAAVPARLHRRWERRSTRIEEVVRRCGRGAGRVVVRCSAARPPSMVGRRPWIWRASRWVSSSRAGAGRARARTATSSWAWFSGLRSNGYTLARHVLLRAGRTSLEAPAWEGASCPARRRAASPVGDLLPGVLDAMADGQARRTPPPTSPAAGSGQPRRALPAYLQRSGRWRRPVPQIFNEIQRLGNVAEEEMARVFNLGVGMILIVDPSGATSCSTRCDSGLQRPPSGHRRGQPSASRW